MIRKIILILILIFILSMFTACNIATIVSEQNYESMFVIVEETPSWIIVYHKDTRVMYAISDSYYIRGIFTLLVDAEGNPLLWNENCGAIGGE